MSKRSSKTHVVGRTIGEKREKLETANERAAARKKDKRKNARRIAFVTIGFVVCIAILVIIAVFFFKKSDSLLPDLDPSNAQMTYDPTIEIVDEESSATEGKITSRMREYIGQVEYALKELGYTPLKAVIPLNSIREVDFYLDGYEGYAKTVIDRGAGVTAEDIDRTIRYLEDQGTTDFEYIDVRVKGQAYWK